MGFADQVAFFIYKRDALRELLQILSDVRGSYGNGQSSHRIRSRNQKLSRRLYIFMQVALIQGLVAWLSTPLLARAFLASDQESPEPARQFPVPLWFPEYMYLSPSYEILYAVQAFCLLVGTQSATCVDAFFIHIMLVVAAELEVLNGNITAMQKERLTVQGREYQQRSHRTVPKRDGSTVESNDYLQSTEHVSLEGIANDMYPQLVKNIHHHHEILRSVSFLQGVMNISIFILLFVNMVDLCSCIFVSAVTTPIVKGASTLSSFTTSYRPSKPLHHAGKHSWVTADVRQVQPRQSLSLGQAAAAPAAANSPPYP
ncbi:uncharacterized protein LOC126199725 [Schistocerca nitens]|uniref:uncharacterized protein LOC126199725 n=1 Tax=Schistocerca nitens TaxID=7011 RepID=UPI0021185475|nr:uncharacterized protein LOC126199725 [Schistocerca nitens]